MIFKWEYRMLLLILEKVFKNASIETNNFTKLLYLKKAEFWIQKME